MSDKPKTLKIVLPEKYRDRITLSIDECCEAIGYGRSSLYEAIRNEELAVVRKGRRTFVPVGELLDWLGRAA
jgi:Helix-turn-helix domain